MTLFWCVRLTSATRWRWSIRFWKLRALSIDQKMPRGTSFTLPAVVKEYLFAQLAGFEHEVFFVLFLDTQHWLNEYAEMFRGTIDRASVYLREVVKEALRLNAAAESSVRTIIGTGIRSPAWPTENRSNGSRML